MIAGGFTEGKTVVCLSSEGKTESLASTHEEVNTRIIWHAVDTDSKFTGDNGRIVIITLDTDIAVLALQNVYYFPQTYFRISDRERKSHEDN